MKKRTTKSSCRKLYSELMKLVKGSDHTEFFFVDHTTINGTKTRTFCYHYVASPRWCEPGALECRGIMFEIDEKEKPIRVMCRTPGKFFNLYENESVQDAEFDTIEYIMVKEDGSLVSSYTDCGYVYLKSKSSIHSDISIAATSVLDSPHFNELRKRVKELADNGFTCNFEYVSPTHRIVVEYDKTNLILHSVRDNLTGEYVSRQHLMNDRILSHYLVVGLDDVQEQFESLENFLNYTRKLEGSEGFVVKTPNKCYKIKSEWYRDRHHFVGAYLSDKQLFQLIVDNKADDVRGMTEDPIVLDRVNKAEEKFQTKLCSDFNTSLRIYNEAKLIANRSKMYAHVYAQCKLNEIPYMVGSIMDLFGLYDPDRVMDVIKYHFMQNYRNYI